MEENAIHLLLLINVLVVMWMAWFLSRCDQKELRWLRRDVRQHRKDTSRVRRAAAQAELGADRLAYKQDRIEAEIKQLGTELRSAERRLDRRIDSERRGWGRSSAA